MSAKEVISMSDYEILAIMLYIVELIILVGFYTNQKK